VSSQRVEILTYELVLFSDRHDFAQAAPWDGDVGGFNCHLEGGTLQARPKTDFADVEHAKEALESHLRAWALWAELEHGIRMEFRFRSAHGPYGRQVMADPATAVGEALDIREGHSSYPQPSPKALAATPLVEDLLGWVRQLRERRQPMLVLVYLFLTRLEFDYKDRGEAAAGLNVSKPILNTLGQLSEKNDPEERRKLKRRQPVERLTEAERQWLLAALPRLALHVAEVEAHGSSPAQLAMDDLPPL
jgi:hypothetical protein